MAAGRKINDEAEARRCVLAAKRAGQSAGEWARAHGIDGRSLHAWKMNFERGQASAPLARRVAKARPVATALVELVPRGPAGTARASYVLEVGEVRLEFGDDVSADTLRRVVEVLRSC